MSAATHRPRLSLGSPQRRRLLKFAAATGLLAAVERNVGARAVCVRLQGARVRVPAGRQRRREHADPPRRRRVPDLRRHEDGRVGHQHCAGAAAAGPARARRTRLRLPPRVRAAAGTLQPEEAGRRRERRHAGAAVDQARPRVAGRAAAGEPVLAQRPGARDPERGPHRLRAGGLGRAHRRPARRRESRHAVPADDLHERPAHVRVGPHVGAVDRAEQPLVHAVQQRRGPVSVRRAARRRAARDARAEPRQPLRRRRAALRRGRHGRVLGRVPDPPEQELRGDAVLREPRHGSGPAAQDHRATDRGSRADADAPAGVLRAPVGLRHARQPGGHPERPAAGFRRERQGLPGRDGRAGPGRQRHDVFAVGVRPHVQAREQPGHRPRLGQLRVRGGRRGQGRRLLRQRTDARAERPGRPRQQRPLDSHDRRSSSTARRLCRWFGIAEGDLPYVFPNIGAFANTNLGFMA